MDPYLCCTFWGSTPSQTLVTYMSHLRWWGVKPPLLIHKCVVTFEGPHHLWFQSHICLTLDDVGQLHLWIHICVVPFKVSLHLWLHSHICLMLDDGGQLHLWLHIQISLCQYYLLYIDINHIYLFFKCHFDSFEWQFGT